MGRLSQTITSEEEKKESDTTTGGGRLRKLLSETQETSTPDVAVSKPQNNKAPLRGVRALVEGDIGVMDAVKEVPDTLKKGASGFVNTFVPAVTKFADTTFSIFGEGLAYAIDPTVKEQYKAGNTDILPTITNTTPKDIVKYTVAAGIETSLYKFLPPMVKMKMIPRGGLGALEGIGFAISEGMAKDKSVEDIIKSMPEYGVSGAAINIIAPYLGPLMRSELKNTPREIKNVFKGLYEEVKPPKPRRVDVISETPSPTRVPISTPNKRYEEYLRKQGYEPYVPDESLPTIPFGQRAARQADDGLPVIRMGDEAIPPRPPIAGARYEPIPIKGAAPGAAKAVGGDVLQSGVDSSVSKIATKAPDPQASVSVPGINSKNVPDITSPTKDPVAFGDAPEASTRRNRQQDFMPVGTGATQTSRLQQRMTEAYESAPRSQVDQLDEVTYQQMNRPQQMRDAAEYVANDPIDAMAVLRGEKSPPKGLLHNSVMLAMEKQAVESGDAATAVRLGSLRSTRAGQEINILRELDPSDPITQIHKINTARREAAKRRLKIRKDPDKFVSEVFEVAKKEIRNNRLKLAEAEKLLDDLIC